MNAQATVTEPEERATRSFVVNLCASTTPVALAPPEDPEFAAYQFFVTRRREEGRERFRLHMGYFASLAEARDKVEDLRKRYPTAWAGPAPIGNTVPDPAQEVTAAQDALDALSNVRQVLATLDIDNPERALLTPAQQWALLESGKLPDPHYAVQLLWSARPVQIESLPQPALFDVYTLYHVEGMRAGVRCYGLRLGFFSDVEAAKRVACYLKPDFETVAIVPVTDAERDTANGDGTPRALRRPAADAAPAVTADEPMLPEIALPEPEAPAEARLVQEALPELPADSPFAPEPGLMAAPGEVLLDGGIASPEPFVLKQPGDEAPTSRPVRAKSALDVRTLDVAPTDASVGPGRPDPRTFELLGASALSVVEDNRAHGMPILPEQPETTDAKLDDLSASAIRHMKGLAKLFSRRGA